MKRTVKAVLSLLVIVSILCCFAACGSGDEPSGTYTLVSMDADGMSVDKDELETMGITAKITFNSDGTGEVDLFGEVEEFTWEDGTIDSNGEELSYELDGDTLTMEKDGEVLVFEK